VTRIALHSVTEFEQLHRSIEYGGRDPQLPAASGAGLPLSPPNSNWAHEK
jgi:hypothetical protein